MIRLPILGVILAAAGLSQTQATIEDSSHHSAVFGETRHFRVFLPPDYGSRPDRRYPVVYFFHGWGERYNRYTSEVKNYDSGTDYGGDTIAAFVGTHDLIVVKWDGYNPRRPGENYPRPYNIGPVETARQFPLYFVELMQYIDSHFRTIADREHRGVSGVSMGGFMALWIAGKYPHLIGSASSFMPSPEYFVGPLEAPAEYRHRDMYPNYNGVRTRLITGTRDFLRWYHRRMNAVWDFARPDYEREEFDSEHGTPGMARTLAFHERSFANPLPRPVLWHHWDVYPSFEVWGWTVSSNRRMPGLTALENVSRSGFRSVVREWAPDGPVLREVNVDIATDAQYTPAGEYQIADANLDTGARVVRRQWADAAGRLRFRLSGARHEVGIAEAGAPVLAICDARVEGTPWATDGRPFRLVLTVLNKGAAAARGVTAAIGERRVAAPDLTPGKTARIAVDMTVEDRIREVLSLNVALTANGYKADLPVVAPFFRDAPPLESVRILDGVEVNIWVQGDKQRHQRVGTGNADGTADAGERIAIGVPDGPAYRLVELFPGDPCVSMNSRITDIWSEYEGQLAHYSLADIGTGCKGRQVPFFARWVVPEGHEHLLKEGVVRTPVQGSGKGTRVLPVHSLR